MTARSIGDGTNPRNGTPAAPDSGVRNGGYFQIPRSPASGPDPLPGPDEVLFGALIKGGRVQVGADEGEFTFDYGGA